MSINQATKARSHVGQLIVGLTASAGGNAIAPATVKKIAAFATTTYTPGAIGAGATVNTTVTVTGVKVGDIVIPNPPSNYGTGGVSFNAYVSAADTVKLVLTNGTLGSVTPGAGVWVLGILQVA